MLSLKMRYYQNFDADFSLDVPSEGFGGWQDGRVDVDPKHTAMVLMHAWDVGTLEEYPGRFRACPTILDNYRICRDVLPPLLETVRASEFDLFHVVGWGDYYKEYSGYKKTVELAGPPPELPPYIEGDPAYHAQRQFMTENVFVGKHNQVDLDRGHPKMKFPREAEPMEGEGIAENAHQLFALCKDSGVNHLIYAGFNIDWCILMSLGGMVDMKRQGLTCSAFDQAVSAVENKETARSGLGKEISLWRVSVGFGFVFDVDDFVQTVPKKVE